MERRVTIDDVARAAGVSVATVSRALRGLPNVAPTTRSKILQVALDLEYEADPNASRLAAGSSRTIAMAVPALGSWYFAQVVAGAEAVMSEAGYDLFVHSVASEDQRRQFLRGPLRKRCDGMIVADLHIPPEEAETLRNAGTRLVTIGDATPSFPAVITDEAAITELAVRHLVALGHRRVGALVGRPDALGMIVPRQRVDGYRAALADRGLPWAPELEAAGDFTIDGGEEAMAELLALDEPPTAVLGFSDEMAMGALVAADRAGLTVPDDVSVLGIDDHDAARVVGLTTVAQDAVGHGARAARLLLELVTDPGATAASVVMATELVTRRTTGRPRG